MSFIAGLTLPKLGLRPGSLLSMQQSLLPGSCDLFQKNLFDFI